MGDSYDKGVIENGFAIEKFRREREEEREYDEYADTFEVDWDAVAENSEDLRKRRISRTEETKQASNKIYIRDERTTGLERKGIAGNQVEFEKDDGGLSR
ncbi:hypothetical protein [Staphylococcus aureus]|uniref:hypothetical protein n=1 Tax=Staphylococcus aureus TaxID=1280 RepID=UPI000B311B61|nr:hypothetical protein [Staphylococcus aureus]